MGDRFTCRAVGPDPWGRAQWRDAGGEDHAAEPDWIEALAALHECDGYVVLMIDPQTAEIDAQGPFGGPEAAVAADALRTSLDAENLDDVLVHIVRLHLPTPTDTAHHHRAPSPPTELDRRRSGRLDADARRTTWPTQ